MTEPGTGRATDSDRVGGSQQSKQVQDASTDTLTPATEAISGTLSALIKWIEGNQEVVKSVAEIVLAVLAVGGTLVGLGVAFAAAGCVACGMPVVECRPSVRCARCTGFMIKATVPSASSQTRPAKVS